MTPLVIGIVGAGIGGLSAAVALSRHGHTVTVYEAGSALTELGAGIQLTPNASKLLLRWGVGEHLPDLNGSTPCLKIRRWQDGALIGQMNTEDRAHQYGGPHALVHRADLQTALARTAEAQGVRILFNSPVRDYDSASPGIILGTGENVTKDLVLAIDGIKSQARQKVCGQSEAQGSAATGLAVFRASLNLRDIQDQPELVELFDHGVNVWAGPHKMAVAYAVRDDTWINIVLEHPETREPPEWDRAAYAGEIKEHFGDWDPLLVRVLSLVQSPSKWPVRRQMPLEQWHSASGRILLMADAAFAVPPFLAQGDPDIERCVADTDQGRTGAAMAIEDAATLATYLDNISSHAQIPDIVKQFQSLRLARRMKVQALSMQQVRLYHLEDGEEQKERDSGNASTPQLTAIWDNVNDQQWLYGYDAEDDAHEHIQLEAARPVS